MTITQRRMEQGRLVYYRQQASADFWDEHWQNNQADAIYQLAQQGIVGTPNIQQVYERYLPTDAPIIEAGCGIGQVVMALRVCGFDIEGVDFAQATIEQVKARFPDLPVRVGDVMALDVPDGHYGGYISIGVIEHRRDGPQPFLDEAWRVLKPGGVALISVPYLHDVRQLKGRMGFYRGQPDGLDFYQYAFSRREFAAFLTQAGFDIIAFECYDPVKGLGDEIPYFKAMLQWPFIGKRLTYRIHKRGWFSAYGHMIMAICRKPEATL